MPRDSFPPQLSAEPLLQPLPKKTADTDLVADPNPDADADLNADAPADATTDRPISISYSPELDPRAAMKTEPKQDTHAVAPGDCHLSEPRRTAETVRRGRKGPRIQNDVPDGPRRAASPKTTSAIKREVMDDFGPSKSQPPTTSDREPSIIDESDKSERSPSPSSTSTLTNCSSQSSTTNASGSSSSSGSTIRQASSTMCEPSDDDMDDVSEDNRHSKRSSRSHNSQSPLQSPPPPLAPPQQIRRGRERERGRPNALNFLEPDSPAITVESIQRSIEESTARWRGSGSGNKKSPSTRSSTSSGSSSMRSDVFSLGDHETDRSSSPENSVDGDSSGATPFSSSNIRTQFATDPRKGTTPATAKSYGTPEMPRGKANLPHIPPNELQPRLGTQFGHAKHLPRAEKLPLSGYQLLASKLSPGHAGSPLPTIQPMYRRFETLNHRILLHLQDELAEMEEQLHRLDTADTQTRRLQNCILPASRRSDYLAGGELQWHKTDILGKIGFKLEQYNHVLSSFEKTQTMSAPSKSEIEDYRSFLETKRPITEIETRFLDFSDDLVTIGRPASPSSDHSERFSSGAPTPMPRFPGDSSPAEFAKDHSHSDGEDEVTKSPPEPSPDAIDVVSPPPSIDASIPSLAAGLAVSILLPILAFPTIPGLLGRMMVVCLVAIGVLNPLLQAGNLRGLGIDTRNAVICAAIYGGAMSVVAAVFA